MATNATQGSAPALPTPVATLQQLWDEANASYEYHEEAENRCGMDKEGEEAAYHHKLASRLLMSEAGVLSHAILYQAPQTFHDALTLASHVFNMVALGTGMTDDDWRALDAGCDGLLAYLGTHPEAQPLGGWNGNSLRHAVKRVKARQMAAPEAQEA